MTEKLELVKEWLAIAPEIRAKIPNGNIAEKIVSEWGGST